MSSTKSSRRSLHRDRELREHLPRSQYVVREEEPTNFRIAPSTDDRGLEHGLRDLPRGKRDRIVRLVNKLVLPDLQATKFDPTYRALWQTLENEYGRSDLTAGLARLRQGDDRDGAVERSLRRLASFPTLLDFGPVDPHPDAHDEHPDLRLWVPSPALPWVLTYLGFATAPGYCMAWESDPIQIDLTMPLGVLQLGLDVYQRDAALEKARPDRERDWDGNEGWEAAFWLLRQAEIRPRRKLRDRVGDLLDWQGRQVSPSSVRDNTGPVRTLIGEAEERVSDIAEVVSVWGGWLKWAEETLLCGEPVLPD